MRQGVNPEKYKEEKNIAYCHRVIIPVYVPASNETYFAKMPEVFKTALEQLLKTINPTTTAVTIINNNSSDEIAAIINMHLHQIDKYVQYGENKGKVYSVLNEARSAYEPFVTIADADVLFLHGWEKAVVDIFKQFPKTGVVAPLPSQGLAFNRNTAVFFDNYLWGKIKLGDVVDKEDSNLYIKGLGNSAILNRNNRTYHWHEKQYYLEKKQKAIIGAGHFVATYRSALFKEGITFPLLKFKNGYEDQFIDILADKKGYYRLSTLKTFAYHIGTAVDEETQMLKQRTGDSVSKDDFEEIITSIEKRLTPYWLRSFIFKLLKKKLKL
jgi:hypothetical protein